MDNKIIDRFSFAMGMLFCPIFLGVMSWLSHL